MGEVYRARDTKLGRDVAITILPRHSRWISSDSRDSNAKRGCSRHSIIHTSRRSAGWKGRTGRRREGHSVPFTSWSSSRVTRSPADSESHQPFSAACATSAMRVSSSKANRRFRRSAIAARLSAAHNGFGIRRLRGDRPVSSLVMFLAVYAHAVHVESGQRLDDGLDAPTAVNGPSVFSVLRRVAGHAGRRRDV